MTLDELQAMCVAYREDDVAKDHFGACRGHLLFFTLVWASKQGNDLAKMHVLLDGDRLPLARDAVEAVIDRIATNLRLWGPQIAALKGEQVRGAREMLAIQIADATKSQPEVGESIPDDAVDSARLDLSRAELRLQQEWELLRIQLVNSVGRYRCPTTAKDEAVSDSLLKLLAALERIPTPHEIREIEAAQFTAFGVGGELARLYDFSTPFYAYAKRAAHNALMDILERAPHNDADELILALTAVIDSPSTETADVEAEVAKLAFRIDFQRMLSVIDRELPTRQHQVVRLTLALRPQFKRALLLILGVVPAEFQVPETSGRSDQAIAAALTRQRPDKPADENDVRVLRFHAKKKIAAMDAVLGALLTQFLDA